MTIKARTQVGIIGAGPAGLLLSHLLALGGVDSVVVEARSRVYCEARQRAGMLEASTVALLRDAGLGDRLDREGMHHDGICLQFAGERHDLNFRELAGRGVTVYAQTEIVKDLIAARLADAQALEFRVTDAAVVQGSGRPLLRYTDSDGKRHLLECDAIAGCDGFHGVSRPAAGELMVHGEGYPYAWLGILARVPPYDRQVVYARHPRGFALASMRTPEVSRLYLQVPVVTLRANWPDDRIWEELALRLELPGHPLATGPILDVSVTPMRTFVAEPMQHGRLFLAGDAAHIVPPTGAKGLNLAVADVAVLAAALTRLLRDGDRSLADAYSGTCLERVWQAVYLARWMTETMHVVPGQSMFETQLQLAQLRRLVSSRKAGEAFAEIYTGAPLRLG
jgi:p-hydroxybenzoate 3-monooxygenase